MAADHSLSVASSQLAAWDKLSSSQDLMIEILKRLPVRCLLRFKSVNKVWYSLITCHLNRKPDPPSGMFLRSVKKKSDSGYVFVPFDVNSPVKFPDFTTLIRNIDPDADYIKLKHSCNGLMLCITENIRHSDYKAITDKHYVFNPTINQLTMVPGSGKFDLGMSLAFDPLKSPYYKIIYVSSFLRGDSSRDNDGYHYQIHMYSSQTHTCKLSYKHRIARRNSNVDFKSAVYWNNAIHWIDRFGFIVYFDLDQEMIYEIKTPAFACFDLKDILKYRSYIFESRVELLLVEIYCPLITKFKIYELKRDYSEWLVKYHVDLEEFDGTLFPESMKTSLKANHFFEFDVLSLVLGVESFLVVETPTKILKLNLDSKTYHILRDYTSPRITPSQVPCLYQWPNVYQFAMSLYNF
ncbi:F-box protein At5g07610-like [Rutidosis leptorrhynchoides]|uniref:F-box protein At5g07610-like n=1 Tax=Rutidosis leptorrhynchoides TaxID=125765 RepID=UPI003A98E084